MVSSYCHPYCFKTDAPNSLIFQIRDNWAAKCLKNKEQKGKNNIKKDTNLEKRDDICFDVNPDIKNYLDETITSRFLPNPEKNWGPLSSAKLIFNPNNLKKPKTE